MKFHALVLTAALTAIPLLAQAQTVNPAGVPPMLVPPTAPLPFLPSLPFPSPSSPYTDPQAPAVPFSFPFPGIAPVSGGNPYMQNLPVNPFLIMMATGGGGAAKLPYQMRRMIDPAEKNELMRMMVPMMSTFMRMGMPEAMNYFARKYKAQPGLSFDDVRDSLFLRANQLNMKKVGENLMWKDFEAVLNDKEAPRIEVYSFCDIEVGRALLKISPEFVVFLPCRVVVMEDANKEIWVLTLDWNMEWVTGYEQKLGLSDELINGANSIYSRLDEMMRAAANGDL